VVCIPEQMPSQPAKKEPLAGEAESVSFERRSK